MLMLSITIALVAFSSLANMTYSRNQVHCPVSIITQVPWSPIESTEPSTRKISRKRKQGQARKARTTMTKDKHPDIAIALRVGNAVTASVGRSLKWLCVFPVSVAVLI